MKLIFVADPMCSWCYGFAKELALLSPAHPELPVEIVVGGVRAGETAIMDDASKQFRLGHWARVEELSGLPFNRDEFLALENFAYNTEPICRAIVTARKLAPDANLLNIFRTLQQAFYVDGRDTTDGQALAEVASTALAASGSHISADAFLAAWQEANTIAETTADFIKARSWGINSFPALLLQAANQRYVVAPGYMHVGELERNLAQVLTRASSGTVA